MYRFRNIIVFCLAVACCSCGLSMFPANVACEETNLDVEVTGVKDRLYKNVMARLRINLYSRSSKLHRLEIERLHEKAGEDIEMALRPYGYYSVSVKGHLSETAGGWKVSYHVDPGERVRISEISIQVTGEGHRLPELSDPGGLFGMKIGDVMDHLLYEKGKKNLMRVARSQGYLDADFTTHDLRIFRKTGKAVIALVLDTKQRYYFGETISDQNIIENKLLLRFLPYEKDDYFTTSKLYQLQRDLYHTDYFGKVVVEGGIADAEGNYIPIAIRLEPHENYNRYSFGVGYATDTGVHVLFEWRNKLINRKGHRLNASFLVGDLESNCTTEYIIPVLDPRYNTVTFSGSWNREKWEGVTTSLLSAGSSFGYQTPSVHYGGALELRDERYKVGSTSGASLILMPQVTGSLAFADDFVDTTNGIRASVYAAGGADNVVSDVSFLKLRGDGKIILTPIPGWRLIGRGTIGGILVDSINNIPPSLRFYAGGAKSVRGYKYRTLGPEDSSGALVGGTFLMTGSVEFEKRVTDLIRTFVFYDVGNAMDDLSVDLVSGIGAGVGLVLPFGHIKLEFAYPLDDDGEKQYFYLNVGADL